MDLGLADRVYVVGGGSAGLGLATATVLVQEGARVVLVGRDPDRLAGAVAGLGEGRAVGVPGDLADPATTPAAIERAESAFGRLDGALANVGGPPPTSPLGTTDEQWTAGFASAFLAPVRLAREVAAHARRAGRQGAAVCFVLSTSARGPLPGLAISNGLRPGLAGHVKDLADELGPPPVPVRVTGVLPGSFATARLAATADSAELEEVAAAVPLRRIGDPPELGRVAAFLLSPAASYVTGTVVTVDGGAVRVP